MKTSNLKSKRALDGDAALYFNLPRQATLDELDRVDSEESLTSYCKLAWPILEPKRRFIHGWHIDAITDHLQAMYNGHFNRLVINVPPGTMKSLTTNVFFPSWIWGPKQRPEQRFISWSYSQDLTIRDNRRTRMLMQSRWYQRIWGHQFKLLGDQNSKIRFDNDATGFKIASSIGGLATGERGDYAIVDDPHNILEAESDAKRHEVQTWFLEVLPTRLNDPEHSNIIVIMQRLHDADVSGIIFEKELGYVSLVLPMEYDPENHCSTSIGFTDPRSDENELLFPERFPREVVERDKRVLGEYACTPHESPVLMADLTHKPIGEVQPGDMVVGWELGDMREGIKFSRQRLTPTKVVKVHKYRAPVVTILLDSGEKIRCTEDHRWYRRERSPGVSEYLPAMAGSPLVRVCPPRLPEFGSEDLRKLGWLAGFFDGEGSVSFMRRHSNCKPVAQIKFYQGAGRNKPLCDKLEEYLTYFGFDFSVSMDTRKDPSKGVNFEYRTYTLKGKSLPLMQRFLYLVQPTKWRDRMIEGAYGAKFNMGFERPVEFVFGKELEDVYALETETGNYVVWGMASSNSAGQFQQRPAPRGGGIFKRVWWNFYQGRGTERPKGCTDRPTFPRPEMEEFDLVMLTIDATFKKNVKELQKESAKGSRVGMLVLGFVGAFIYVLDDWTQMMSFHETIANAKRILGLDEEWTGKSYPDIICTLVELKANGQAIVDTLVTEVPGVIGVEPEGGKESRAHAITPRAKAGQILLPEGESWVPAFVDEFGMFGSTARNDRVDALSQGIIHLQEGIDIARTKALATFE